MHVTVIQVYDSNSFIISKQLVLLRDALRQAIAKVLQACIVSKQVSFFIIEIFF